MFTVLDFFFFLGLFALLLLFSFFVIWWLSLVFCLESFFIFVCVSIVDFWFAVTVRFWYSSLYVKKIDLSCWSFPVPCFCAVLFLGLWYHIYVWVFPTFTVCLPLLVSASICNFIFSICVLFHLGIFLQPLLHS